jgi:hypothetical protein
MSGAGMRLTAGAGPVAGLVIGTLVIWAAASSGIWEAPLAVAAIWAAAMPASRLQYGGAIAMVVLGYGLPLSFMALSLPLGRTASEVAAIMGFGHEGAIVWALTAALPLGEAVVGAWIGHASRRLALAPPGGAV